MRLLLTSCFALMAGACSAQPWAENRPPAGTAHSLPAQLFPPDHPWNQRVADAPIDPNSATILSQFGARLWYDFGNNYGIPYCTVSGDHPKVLFDQICYAGESDGAVPFPIPAKAYVENGWSEQLDRTITNPDFAGHDRHLMCVDVDNNRLYEIYQIFYNADTLPVARCAPVKSILPGQHYAAQVSTWDMNTNNVRPAGWTSADAAGMPLLPGLIQYDEVMSGQPIKHAHRVTLNLTSSTFYVWPATHKTASCSLATCQPLGTRFRLKSSKVFTGQCANPTTPEYKAAVRFLQSVRDYGLIVDDNGTTGLVGGTNDARWGAYNSLIRSAMGACINQITMSTDLEVVERGWSPPLEIVTTTLPPAQQGVPYHQIVRGTGGYNNYVWTIPVGSLPQGLTMKSTGTWMEINGTPAGVGTSSFTAHVADAHSPPQTKDQALSLSVTAASAAVPNPPGQPTIAAEVKP